MYHFAFFEMLTASVPSGRVSHILWSTDWHIFNQWESFSISVDRLFFILTSALKWKVTIIEKSMRSLKPQSCDWHDYRQLTDKAGLKFQGRQFTLFEKPLLSFSISKWKQIMVIFLAHFYSNLFCLCLYFLLHPNKYFWLNL